MACGHSDKTAPAQRVYHCACSLYKYSFQRQLNESGIFNIQSPKAKPLWTQRFKTIRTNYILASITDSNNKITSVLTNTQYGQVTARSRMSAFLFTSLQQDLSNFAHDSFKWDLHTLTPTPAKRLDLISTSQGHLMGEAAGFNSFRKSSSSDQVPTLHGC